MCNHWCLEFASNSLLSVRKPARILEVGSRNVNGSIRDVLSECASEYIGVDLFDGPGVDIVCDVAKLTDTFTSQSFDIVVSTEMLEHCLNWQDAVYQMASALRQDGLLLITTRSPGFETHDYPADYWRFSYSDFEKIFQPLGEIVALQNDMTLGWPCGIGVVVKKKLDQSKLSEWKSWLDTFAAYSMTDNVAHQKTCANLNPEGMIFDQYSRYKACSDLLRQAGFASGDTVLDVGSGPECLFGQFMQDAEITYVDPLIPGDSEKGRITGDVFTSGLDGRSFDCVSAVDVFEHVPAEKRQAFLERMSSLSKNFLIIGFPTSDSSSAMETDKAIDDQYRNIFGQHYSWLEEHERFGLPSLADTVGNLTRLGWRCQTVGHGHAPWLQELLSYVICTLNIPSMKNIIIDISEKFNRKLYAFDFRAPHYRQFVIASRNSIPAIAAPGGKTGSAEADALFRELMDDARHQYYAQSLRRLAGLEDGHNRKIKGLNGAFERQIEELHDAHNRRIKEIGEAHNQLLGALNQKIEEASAWGQSLQAKLVERDELLVSLNRQIQDVSAWGQSLQSQRDAAVAELETIKRYRVMKLLRFLGVVKWIIINRRVSDLDRAHIKELLRSAYQRLPSPIRMAVKWGYLKFTGNQPTAIQKRILSNAHFQAQGVLPSAQIDGRPDYIIWGVIDWKFRHQRPQHLALGLSASGRRVFYISVLLVDDARPGFDVEQLDEDGRLFQLNLYAKGSPMIYYSAPSVETVRQLRESIGEALQWADSQNLVSLVQHPFWYDIARVLPNSRMVYDCMDHHEGFGNVAAEVLTLECALFRDSDLTVTTSDYLDKIIEKQAKRRALIRNAGEYGHFAHRPASVYRDPQGRKVIGYYGAIAEWFDQDLVEAVAKRFPDCAIMLVGADTVDAKSRLGKSPNVTFIGETPYKELPYYLYGFDVCLLPFKIIPLTLATNPVKLYEYLSAGKTVVTVDLPEMKQFGNLVHVAGNADDFLSAVATSLSQPAAPESIAARQAFAKEQTWTHRVEALISYVEASSEDPLVSVIVVTYNNLDMTKECLASIDKYSAYSQLEIIVVDNASSDGSREFLIEWSSAAPNRKLILNDDNKGFATGNNQGLAIASGEYLVMLNNDTYVTPGWVRTLLNHLRRDSGIGLINPVTNNIGNEAKIEIAYRSMDEMLSESAGYTRRHIGQTLPLRTAAFFCVMMRRDVYERVGPLDEAFGRGFFEDDDYCRRVEQAGLRVVCAEDVFVHHHLSASFNKLKNTERQALFDRNKAVYEAKWGKWIPHTHRKDDLTPAPSIFNGYKHVSGKCNVCGNNARFFYTDEALWRESLTCEYCLTTSRYRSIARGILRAIGEISGVEAKSLAALQRMVSQKKLRIYDTQPPFYFEPRAYPLPDLLKASGWIDVELSQFKPKRPLGELITPGVTNQNLESLTFADSSLDVVITSDVMEHVRLDALAHMEIHRVLRPGGVHVFTVPNNRNMSASLIRVQVTDPNDPAKDIHLLNPEYHGDANLYGGSALSYRVYGRDLDDSLTKLGFEVTYSREDIPELGILNTELYYCRKVPS